MDPLRGPDNPAHTFCYLARGGVGQRTLAPGRSFEICTTIEYLLTPVRDRLAIFAHLVLERTSVPSTDHRSRKSQVP